MKKLIRLNELLTEDEKCVTCQCFGEINEIINFIIFHDTREEATPTWEHTTCFQFMGIWILYIICIHVPASIHRIQITKIMIFPRTCPESSEILIKTTSAVCKRMKNAFRTSFN
jgi:hypothetical protein